MRSGAALGIRQLYDRYRRDDAPTIWRLRDNPALASGIEDAWLLKYAQAVNIKVVAVWDTVGALGG